MTDKRAVREESKTGNGQGLSQEHAVDINSGEEVKQGIQVQEWQGAVQPLNDSSVHDQSIDGGRISEVRFQDEQNQLIGAEEDQGQKPQLKKQISEFNEAQDGKGGGEQSDDEEQDGKMKTITQEHLQKSIMKIQGSV